VIADGYGEAFPTVGIVIALEFVKDLVPIMPEVTVKLKVSLEVREPSLTVTVITALPLCPAAGVTVTVRLAPEPPKTTFEFGTRVGLEDEPLKVRLITAVSISPTVKDIGPTAVPSDVD
jgi:hypothetical protein